MTATDRALAKAAGAAQRIAVGVGHLARIADDLAPGLRLQAHAVVEEFDLLRFMLREATLYAVITAPARNALEAEGVPDGTATPPKAKAPRGALQAPAKGRSRSGHARAAKLSPAQRKAITSKAAKARWRKT